jgi:hypothetical protein
VAFCFSSIPSAVAGFLISETESPELLLPQLRRRREKRRKEKGEREKEEKEKGRKEKGEKEKGEFGFLTFCNMLIIFDLFCIFLIININSFSPFLPSPFSH